MTSEGNNVNNKCNKVIKGNNDIQVQCNNVIKDATVCETNTCDVPAL